MNWLEFVILALATWRLSSMIVREDGPAYVFRGLRELSGITHDESGVVVMIPDGFLPQLLSCVYCSSIWVGFIWTVFWVLAPVIAVRFAALFALSALAVVFDRHMGH